MSVDKKKLSWQDFILMVSLVICGGCGIYNIHYSAVATIIWLLASSLLFALYVVHDEKNLVHFTKWELIRVILFKNYILFGVLVLGVIYNLIFNNLDLYLKFLATVVFYVMLMIFAGGNNEVELLEYFSVTILLVLLSVILLGGLVLILAVAILL